MQTAILSYNALRQNTDFRFDADYAVHPLTQGTQIYKARFIPLQDILKYISSGHTPYLHDVSQGDVDFVTVECIGDLTLDENSFKHITKEQFANEFVKNRVIRDSVLCTIKRRICKAYPFLEAPLEPMAMNQDVAFLIPKQDIDPVYLATYLCCKVGQSFANRQKTEQMNPYISVANLCQLPIAVLSGDFQKSIRNVFELSFQLNQKSIDAYKTSERLLLSELGLLNWKPKHRLSFVKKYSDTNSAERIDAEYFQPMYEEIIESVKKYRGGFVKLGEVAKTKRGSLISDTFYSENKGTPYIRGADFSSGFLGDSKLVYIDNSFKPSNEAKIKKDDIVFALIGTVGATALVDAKFDGAFISNNLGKITTKNYNSTVLQILLHSIIGMMYFRKEQTQTAQPKISDKDAHGFILPLLKDEVIDKIDTQYLESQKAKSLSKILLNTARRSVEMAIEKSEKDAQSWIDAELKKLNICLD